MGTEFELDLEAICTTPSDSGLLLLRLQEVKNLLRREGLNYEAAMVECGCSQLAFA